LIEYENGELWWHGEHVGNTGDNYVALASNKIHDYFNLNSPMSIKKKKSAEDKVKPTPIFAGFNSMASPAYASAAGRTTFGDDIDMVVSCRTEEEHAEDEEDDVIEGEDDASRIDDPFDAMMRTFKYQNSTPN